MTSNLLELAQQALDTGLLPSTLRRAMGGRGSGSRCALCGEPITSAMPEIELDGGPSDTRIVMHSQCHVAWSTTILKSGKETGTP